MFHTGYYVYRHLTADGRTIYIGKGIGPRAWELKGRDGYHKNCILEFTHDYVEIEAHGLEEREAILLERRLIRAEDPIANIQERIK